MHATPAGTLWLIPLLPLLGAAWNGFFGKSLQARYGSRVVSAVGCGTVILSFLLSLYAFQQLLGVEPRLLEQKLWTWFSVGDLHVDFSYRVDPLTAVMLLVVTGVGFLIHIYSIGYMDGRPGLRTGFFAFLNLFTVSMLMLVLGANLL